MENSFMRKAIEISVENVERNTGGPFAAVVVHDGQALAVGVNCVTSTNDPTAHAEVVAIRAACRTLRHFSLAGCELYTTCEPCPMCLGAIYWARINKVFFGNTREDAAGIGFDDSIIYEQLSLAPTERSIPMQRMMAEEAAEAFRAWQRSARKILY
jgi:guanine deaminase